MKEKIPEVNFDLLLRFGLTGSRSSTEFVWFDVESVSDDVQRELSWDDDDTWNYTIIAPLCSIRQIDIQS